MISLNMRVGVEMEMEWGCRACGRRCWRSRARCRVGQRGRRSLLALGRQRSPGIVVVCRVCRGMFWLRDWSHRQGRGLFEASRGRN